MAGWRVEPVPAAAGAAGRRTAQPARFRAIDEPGYTTWIAVGHPVPAIAAADEAAVAVMTDILNIRLNITIREIRGLANRPSPDAGDDAPRRPAAGAQRRTTGIGCADRRFSLQELARIREPAGAPTADELEQVKGGLVLGRWQGSLDGARDASITYAIETARLGPSNV